MNLSLASPAIFRGVRRFSDAQRKAIFWKYSQAGQLMNKAEIARYRGVAPIITGRRLANAIDIKTPLNTTVQAVKLHTNALIQKGTKEGLDKTAKAFRQAIWNVRNRIQDKYLSGQLNEMVRSRAQDFNRRFLSSVYSGDAYYGGLRKYNITSSNTPGIGEVTSLIPQENPMWYPGRRGLSYRIAPAIGAGDEVVQAGIQKAKFLSKMPFNTRLGGGTHVIRIPRAEVPTYHGLREASMADRYFSSYVPPTKARTATEAYLQGASKREAQLQQAKSLTMREKIFHQPDTNYIAKPRIRQSKGLKAPRAPRIPTTQSPVAIPPGYRAEMEAAAGRKIGLQGTRGMTPSELARFDPRAAAFYKQNPEFLRRA